MPASTPLGIRYPLSSEPPVVHTDMQRLATDVDGLLTPAYGAAGIDTSISTPSTGTIFFTTWTQRYLQGGVTANTSGLVVPVAGTYEVTAWCRFSALLANALPRLVIGNGASTIVADASGPPAAVSANQSLYITRCLPLAAAEQVRCGMIQGVASSLQFVGGATVNGLIVRLIRKS